MAATAGATNETKARPGNTAGIELRHLVTLAAVARDGSFGAAAESLGYVQSAVSAQLAQLERLAGTRLVERRRGVAPVGLTEAGRMLLGHSDEILARLGSARADLAAVLERSGGSLTVGADQSVAKQLLPAILSSWVRRQPAVDVQVRESVRGDDLAELVTAGELDLAFADPAPAGDELDRIDLLRDPYLVLLPADWQIARLRPARPVTLADLATLPMIGPGEGATATPVEAALREHGFEPRYILRSDLDSAVGALVGAGLGAAILPRLAIDAADRRTVALPLGELVPPREIALYRRPAREASPVLDAFTETAMTVCSAVSDDDLPVAA